MNHKETAYQGAENTRQTYESPELQELGDIVTMTQASVLFVDLDVN